MLSAVRQHAPGLHAQLPAHWQRNAHHTPDQDDGDDAAGADDAVSAKVALGPLGRASDGISQSLDVPPSAREPAAAQQPNSAPEPVLVPPTEGGIHDSSFPYDPLEFHVDWQQFIDKMPPPIAARFPTAERLRELYGSLPQERQIALASDLERFIGDQNAAALRGAWEALVEGLIDAATDVRPPNDPPSATSCIGPLCSEFTLAPADAPVMGPMGSSYPRSGFSAAASSRYASSGPKGLGPHHFPPSAAHAFTFHGNLSVPPKGPPSSFASAPVGNLDSRFDQAHRDASSCSSSRDDQDHADRHPPAPRLAQTNELLRRRVISLENENVAVTASANLERKRGLEQLEGWKAQQQAALAQWGSQRDELQHALSVSHRAALDAETRATTAEEIATALAAAAAAASPTPAATNAEAEKAALLERCAALEAENGEIRESLTEAEERADAAGEAAELAISRAAANPSRPPLGVLSTTIPTGAHRPPPASTLRPRRFASHTPPTST